MSERILTCDETPVAWPKTVALTDLRVSPNSGLFVSAPQAGSLQVLTRRAGDGVGDGVNIQEAANVAADYRGQRYMLDESIFHVPGLHVFPEQTEVYPAEYHLHFSTLAQPLRKLTVVVPVSHKVTGPGADYFAAASKQPDPSRARPVLTTLLPPGTRMVQFQGPDPRGRTADKPTAPTCDPQSTEHHFLLVLNVAAVAARDLERIPREGSLSTDPRDLPAPGIAPTKMVTSERLKRAATLAVPGILASVSSGARSDPSGGPVPRELECLPLEVVDGNDVINVDGKAVPLSTLTGGGASGILGTALLPGVPAPPQQADFAQVAGNRGALFGGILLGIGLVYWFVTRYVVGYVFVVNEDSDVQQLSRLANMFWGLTIIVTAGVVFTGNADQLVVPQSS
jgi:hypothetical protein